MEQEQPVDELRHRTHRRPPWWMCAAAVVLLIFAAARYYAWHVEPEDPGITFQSVNDEKGLVVGALLKAVRPDSAAAKAGFLPGDIILIPNLNSFVSPVPELSLLYWEANRTYRLEIKRKDEGKIVFLKLGRNNLGKWLAANPAVNRPTLVAILLGPFFLILAAIVAFARPYDPAARWGALFIVINAINAINGSVIPVGWFRTFQVLPRAIFWLDALLPSLCGACFVSAGITFFAVFPRKFFQRPWFWGLAWFPAVILIPPAIFSDHAPFYSFARWWPDWYGVLAGFIVVAGIPMVGVVLILNYKRLQNLNEKRRVRVVMLGLLVTIIAYVPSWTFLMFRSSSSFVRLYGNLRFTLFCLAWAFPVSMVYAILRHRIFDIRVMVRLGLRYAVARGVLLSLVPIVAIILAGDLYFHQDQPLRQIMSQRGLLYAMLACGGFLLHIRRRLWLDAVDRRFFRERYDAQRVLRAVVDEIREARSFEKVAPHVVSQVETALHPEFAALLVRKPGEAKYRVLAAQEQAPPPIQADSKLMGLVRLLGKPVEISQSQTDWLRSQLPQQESEFLRQARLEWLFPICLVEGQMEALLAMGPKRSEEPYSREDQELLQGITSSLAILLEQSPSLAPVREGFEECPQCGTCYDTGSGSCNKEGAKLISLSLPRLLDHRYRFEQRLGEGGMGMVYRAFDTELERQVAVKLIRSDITASAEAAARFKQEAKAAASFTHPNVVTVYDFGVAENQRAYLVMELLRGLTLRQELSRSGRLPAPRTSEILRDVCTAVDAAHHQRLLHRDLKPENIFLVGAGTPEIAKILDFGVVKPIALTDTTLTIGQTGPGMLVGTLKYMSPEQLRGEKPAESWDLWALAVVAYEMLTGVHPFGGSTALDVHNAILASGPIPLRRHLPDAPQTWQDFFDQTLSSRVDLRPASALEFFSRFTQSVH
jgi:hypothetical protein